jgi:hypothetical protein
MRLLCSVPHFSRKLGRTQWRIPGYKRRCRGIRAYRIQNTTAALFSNIMRAWWQLPVPTGCLTSRNMITDARLTSVRWEHPDSRLFKSSGVMTPCHWVGVPDVPKDIAASIFKNESLQEELSFFLFCTMTNKSTVISQIITLLHVLALSRYPQTACYQYLAKLHKYFKCSCW